MKSLNQLVDNLEKVSKESAAAFKPMMEELDKIMEEANKQDFKDAPANPTEILNKMQNDMDDIRERLDKMTNFAK